MTALFRPCEGLWEAPRAPRSDFPMNLGRFSLDFGFIFRSPAPAHARSDFLAIFYRVFAHFVSDLALARRSLGRSFLRLRAKAPFAKNLQKHWPQQQNQGSALLGHRTCTTALALKKT